jgi:hypothetical protein
MSALANDLDCQNATINQRNAANAQHSTGPTSPAGKERVKFNALKSGLFARTIVLPHEEQSAYEAVGAFVNNQWKPRTDTEREIVLTIQNTTWRLNRVEQLESSLYAFCAQQHLDEIAEQFPKHDHFAQYSLAEAAGYLPTPAPSISSAARKAASSAPSIAPDAKSSCSPPRARRSLRQLPSRNRQNPKPHPPPNQLQPHLHLGLFRQNIPGTCPASPGPRQKSIAASGCARTPLQIWRKKTPG